MNNDLISREALKKAVENLVAGGEERLKEYYENGSKSEENEWIGGVYDTWELIGNATTVERPQGEWQLHGMIYYCSECGHECGESGDNFCGNCGADMRGDRG